jgi:hypothetical protein
VRTLLEDLLAEGVLERGAPEVATMARDASTPGSTNSGQDAFGSGPERGEATERRDFLRLSLATGAAPLTLALVLTDAQRRRSDSLARAAPRRSGGELSTSSKRRLLILSAPRAGSARPTCFA